MAKRSVDDRDSEWVKVEVEQLEVEPLEVEQPRPTVQLRLLKSLTVNYVGPITGQLYIFSGSGSIVEVDAEDAPLMLMKKGNKKCCPTSVGPQPYFEIVR